MQTDIMKIFVLNHIVSIQVINGITIPYKTFNLMKKSGFIKNAMDGFVSVNEIRLENFIQVRRSCSNDTLVYTYYFITMYYIKITIQGIRIYSIIKDSPSVLYANTYVCI